MSEGDTVPIFEGLLCLAPLSAAFSGIHDIKSVLHLYQSKVLLLLFQVTISFILVLLTVAIRSVYVEL